MAARPPGFLRQSTHYLTATGVSTALVFLSLPIYTRYLSPADFGIVALFLMFGGVASKFISIGLRTATFRYFFQYQDDRPTFQALNFSNLAFNVVLFVLFGVPIYGLGEWIGRVLFDSQLTADLIVLSYVSGGLEYFFSYLSSLLMAEKRSQAFSMLTIVRSVGNFLLTTFFIFAYAMTYMARIYGVIYTQIAIVLYLLWATRHLLQWRFSRPLLMKSLKFSYPKLPINVVGMLYSSLDKLLLTNLRGMTEVGYYDFGGKFASVVNMAMEAVANAWGPFFLEQARLDTDAARQAIVTRFYEVTFALLWFSLGVMYFSEEAIRLLATPEFYPSIYVAPVYTYCYLTGILAYLGANQLMQSERMMAFLVPTLVSMALSISLNLVLIPSFGAIGAAIATAAAAGGANVIMLYVGMRAYPVPLRRRRLAALFGLHMVFTGGIYPLFWASWPLVVEIGIKLVLLAVFLGIGIRCQWISPAKLWALVGERWRSPLRTSAGS